VTRDSVNVTWAQINVVVAVFGIGVFTNVTKAVKHGCIMMVKTIHVKVLMQKYILMFDFWNALCSLI
jgi:hypothetical protein